MPNDNCNGGDIHCPLLPKPVVGAPAAPSCRYVNLSRSPSDNRSNVDDVDAAAVHIQLRADDADDVATDQPHHATDAGDGCQTAPAPAPVCGGYIIVGPDTFGHFDAATGCFINTDSGIETGSSLPQRHNDGGTDLALASGQNRQNSDLVTTGESCRQPAGETVTVSDGVGFGNVSDVQGNGKTDDSTPVTNYAVIMGMNDNEPHDADRCSMDTHPVGLTHNVAERPDNNLTAGEELPPDWSVPDEEQHDDLAVPFGVSSPPVCYSLNSGGYLSHSELFGAAPAV